MGRKSKNQASNVDGNNGATEQDEFVEPTSTATPVQSTPVQSTPAASPSPAKQGK
jgi:hypothetical protein